MFYAHFVLAKKGPLARIWLAAHWDKKLTKAHVFETNIEKSVDGILQPKVKMALRTSGHLLLGVVRIYSRKAKYLLADCNEAFVKIKMAFRPGMVDLPEEHREAAVTAITLPEVFHDFDSAMPELNDVDIEAQFCMNQSRAEEITMREDYANVPLSTHDDGFGDIAGFDSEGPELMRDPHSLEPALCQADLLFHDGPSVDHVTLEREKTPQPSTSGGQSSNSLEIDAPLRDDGFGGNIGQEDMISEGFFGGNIFDDPDTIANVRDVPNNDASAILHPALDATDSITAPEKTPRAISARDPDSDDDMGDRYDAVPSPRDSSHGDSRPGSPLDAGDLAPQMMPPTEIPPAVADTSFPEQPEEPVADEEIDHEQENEHPDQTTLLHNEEESFALAPVDASALKGFTKTKRKRKLIVDETKNISGEEMKSQLSDTSDILTTLDLAPPTKRLMHWKETGGVEKLFALPGRPIPARALFKNYQRHLTSKAAVNEDHAGADDRDAMPLDNMEDLLGPASVVPTAGLAPPPPPAPEPRTRRKRKLQDQEEALPPAQRRAMEEDEDEPHLAMGHPLETPLQVNNMGMENQHGLMEPPTPHTSHMDPQTPGGPLSVPGYDPHTPAPQTPYLDPHTPGGPLSVANSYLDPHTPGGPLSVAGQFMDPQTPGSVLDGGPPGGPFSVAQTPVHIGMHSDIPDIPIDQVNMLLEQHEHVLPHVDHSQSTPGSQANSSVQNGPASQQNLTPDQHALMENVGYDQNNALMANMGYDGHGEHHPAMTPGAVSERGPTTPWNDDYEFPHSAGPPDEQQTDETYEQFEERVLNKRAAHMYHIVKNKLAKNSDNVVAFSEMTHRNNRKQAAQKFYTLLVLKKHQVLELQQDCSYGDILVTRGRKFDNPSL